jgi:NADPH2:quinone reductase
VFAVTIVEAKLEWKEHPDLRPGGGEVVVNVRAAGVNAADLMQREGRYPAPPGAPADIPGLEFAGEVTAVGDGVTRVAVGDRVMGINGGGSQAEQVVVAAGTVLRVPEGIPWDQAGGFPEAFFTACDALFSQGGVTAGERVLISGAAGGVGTAAVQLAHAAGAHVVASVRSEERRAEVGALGADTVIDPSEVAEHGPYDVSLELVGGQAIADVLPYLAVGGRVVVIGVMAGAKIELNLLKLMASRSTIGGSMLRSRTIAEKSEVTDVVANRVLPLLAKGDVVVPVAERFPMADAVQAYERFSAGGKFGKVVLIND